MLELLHAVGVPTCDACGERTACPDPQIRLCSLCRETWPDRLASLPPSEGVSYGWALGPYAGPVGLWVRRAKYSGDGEALARLGGVLARLMGGVPADVVVPVPSGWFRSVSRGFVPADLLATPVARQAGVPVRRCLVRVGGPAQAGLARRLRAANVAARFEVRGRCSGRVLLVDDVVTTGSTMAACASALLGAGAREVWALAAARSS